VQAQEGRPSSRGGRRERRGGGKRSASVGTRTLPLAEPYPDKTGGEDKRGRPEQQKSRAKGQRHPATPAAEAGPGGSPTRRGEGELEEEDQTSRDEERRDALQTGDGATQQETTKPRTKKGDNTGDGAAPGSVEEQGLGGGHAYSAREQLRDGERTEDKTLRASVDYQAMRELYDRGEVEAQVTARLDQLRRQADAEEEARQVARDAADGATPATLVRAVENEMARRGATRRQRRCCE